MASQNDVILRSPHSGRLEGRTTQPQPSAAAVAKRVCVGVVTGAHGVRGAVRIKSFTAEPGDVAKYGPLEDEAGERQFKLRGIGTAKGVVIAKVTGIVDRDRAEALRGLRLYLPREALPPAEDDEFYHADLIGLEARLPDGSPIGRVCAVHDFGAGADTLEIAPAGGKSVMVPFTRAVVPTIDLASGHLVIDPPPGLLDPIAKSPSPSNGGRGKGKGGRADDRLPAPSPQPSPPVGEREKTASVEHETVVEPVE